eukprot:5905842-Alexandrium_andersonii.AAC.1
MLMGVIRPLLRTALRLNVRNPLLHLLPLRGARQHSSTNGGTISRTQLEFAKAGDGRLVRAAEVTPG